MYTPKTNWRVVGSGGFCQIHANYADEQDCTVYVASDLRRDDAEFIVDAIQQRDELLAACEFAYGFAQGISAGAEMPVGSVIELLKSAITSAKGDTDA